MKGWMCYQAALLGWFCCTLCLSTATCCAQSTSSTDDTAALERRVAEQERRISELEETVRKLSVQAGPPEAGGPAPADDAAPKPAQDSAKPMKEGTRQSEDKLRPGADIYLYQYVPVNVPGARAKFELYAASLQLEGQHDRWGFAADYRVRTTKLRSYFPGNTWLQQGYVSYTTDVGAVKVGSFYRRVGLVWDDSFYGNIQYFDGLKLSPDFGVGFEGTRKLNGRFGLEYSTQYFSTDSRINGSLPGRDFVSVADTRLKNDVTWRLAPVWNLRKNASLTVGISGANGVIDRDSGPHNRRTQIAGDATLQFGGVVTYAEVLRQAVEGPLVAPPLPATYTLVGMRWARGRYQPHVNYSQGNYHGLAARREYIFQPGITVQLAHGFSFIYEYTYWRSLVASTNTPLDNSLNFVLHYHF